MGIFLLETNNKKIMYGRVNRNVIVQAYICMIGPSNEIHQACVLTSNRDH